MKVILVAGATGQQGGSVIRALSDSEDYICLALTRNPETPKAQKLQHPKNVKLISGDLNDIQQLRAIFEDAKSTPEGAIWGVFVALEYPGLGGNAESEENQGKNIATVAQEFQVQSYIYTTSCMLPFPMTSRLYLKQLVTVNYLSKTSAPEPCTHRILRPGFFMENFNTSVSGRFTSAAVQCCMSPDVKLQLLVGIFGMLVGTYGAEPIYIQTVDDVGRFSRMIFDDPLKLNHKTIDVATPGLDAQERSQTFLQAAGYDIPSIPSLIIHTVYWLNRHVQNMVGDFVQSDELRKLDPQGYDANLQEAANHMKLVRFEEWARRFNQNADREVNEHGVTVWGLLSKRT